ncbi:MAG TPA: hypothetical protein VFV84_07070 [Burkholderiales bacterium]|nr:hypothetical protein [Burkholderiales bacterium]
MRGVPALVLAFALAPAWAQPAAPAKPKAAPPKAHKPAAPAKAHAKPTPAQIRKFNELQTKKGAKP